MPAVMIRIPGRVGSSEDAKAAVCIDWRPAENGLEEGDSIYAKA